MDPILNGLNAAQHAAVTSPASVLQVLAPPGSGKTKTLTSRVAYMLRNSGYKPWNVICLTFTIKSSREMKERIAKLIGSGVEKRLQLGTFHSVCRRYLIAYGHLIGIEKNFGIADTSDTLSIIKRIVKRSRLNIDPKMAQSRISKAKSKGLRSADLELMLAKKKNIEEQEIVTVFNAYQEHLNVSKLLDYDDLLLRCVDLLRQHPACVSNVEAVLVDEFQDTNMIQFDLMRLFATHQKRVTTVGDPDQSIYGWRSAEIKNLKRMQKQYPDTLVINLEDNYRSSGAILLAAQEIIEQDESRPPKSISPTHCPGTVPVLRALPSAEVEARWIVSEIIRLRALTGRLLHFSDFAVLLRSASLSRLIEAAMNRENVPYRMVGGQRFFDRLETKLLLDYLRVISQPNNNDALIRIVNVPARGIGAVTIKGLLEEAESRKESLWHVLGNVIKGHRSYRQKLSKGAEQGVSKLMSIIISSQFEVQRRNSTPEELLKRVIDKLDFQVYLRKSHPEDHEARWANVEELIVQAADCSITEADHALVTNTEASLPTLDGVGQAPVSLAEESLSKFLGNVALATEIQTEDERGTGDGTQHPVTISTIHAAKGLEWGVVFVPCAYEGCIPHSRAEDTDEERRLLYVAMTRAQGLLYLSCPVTSSQRDQTTLSPFLSTKKVKIHLTNQGPKIDGTTIVDLSRILRRDCPSNAAVEQESRQLKNRNDDLWPLAGENNVEERNLSRQNLSGNFGGTVSKRQKDADGTRPDSRPQQRDQTSLIRTSTLSMGSATTMQSRETFTMPNPQPGFCTAATQLRLQANTESYEGFGDRPNGASGNKSKSAVAKKASQVQVSANNLLSMWGISGNVGRSVVNLSCQALAPVKGQATRQPKSPTVRKCQDPDVELSPPPSPKRQQLGELEGDADVTSRDYILLSSSPPREGNRKIKRDDVDCDRDPEACSEDTSASFHKSNISRPRETQTYVRKTLGMRRSLNGWPPQGNRRARGGIAG